MEDNEPCYIAYGVSYTSAEEKEAQGIRELSDDEEREFLAKCFEVETGKPFPFEQGVCFEYNPPTALLDSRETDVACRFIAENPRLTRKQFPLE